MKLLKENRYLKEPVLSEAIDLLSKDIKEGLWKPGEKLPSIRKLSHARNVCKETMHKAIKVLERRGLIESYPRCGNFIISNLSNVLSRKKIGIVSSGDRNRMMFDPFYGQVMKGFSKAFENKCDYDMIMLNRTYDLKEYLIAEKLDGIIDILPPENSGASIIRDIQKYPHVALNIHPDLAEKYGCVYVNSNNYSTTGKLLDKLFAAGHRHIEFIVRKSDDCGYASNMVTAACRDFSRKYRLKNSAFWEVDNSQFVDEIIKKINRERNPTALFFSCFQLAMGGVYTLRSLGVKIPQQISVAGFQDYGNFYRIKTDFLTAKEPDFDLGVIAGQLLLKQLKNEPLNDKSRILECSIIENPSWRKIKKNEFPKENH